MKNNLLIRIMIILFNGLIILVASLPAHSEDLTGDPGKGKLLFTQYSCYACHGYTGETGSAQRLNPPRFNQAGFMAYVRTPPMTNRRGLGSWMPPYSGEDVTDQDLADIYAFISALPSNSPALEDIPLLKNN